MCYKSMSKRWLVGGAPTTTITTTTAATTTTIIAIRSPQEWHINDVRRLDE